MAGAHSRLPCDYLDNGPGEAWTSALPLHETSDVENSPRHGRLQLEKSQNYSSTPADGWDSGDVASGSPNVAQVGRKPSGRRQVRKRSMLEAIAVEKNIIPAVKGKYDGRGDSPLEHFPQTRPLRPAHDTYRFGEGRFPLLQTTVDELAAREHGDSGPGPISPTTDPDDYAFTTSRSIERSGYTSPTTSPVQIPYTASPFPERHNASYVQPVSYRSALGRSPSSSSWSPASVFLSKWTRSEVAKAPSPDDEGQELGDDSEYVIGKQIGHGGFSVVKQVHTFERGARVVRAVKIVRKQIAGQSEEGNEKAQMDFEREVAIWRFLKHEYVLPLISVFDSPFATFCITQYNAGGTLFDLVARYRRRERSAHSSSQSSAKDRVIPEQGPPSPRTARPHACVPINLVKRYVYQLASALRYLHQDVRLVHRDVKLENCLINTTPSLDQSPSPLTSEMENLDPRPTEANPGNVLLCDFGMADFISSDERSSSHATEVQHFDAISETDKFAGNTTHAIGPGPNSSISVGIAGSLQYASPETLASPVPTFQPSRDIWAFGVTLYALIVGDLPFRHSLEPKLVSLIMHGEWDLEAVTRAIGSRDLDGDAIDRESDTKKERLESALELLKGCLDMDERRRWDAERILESRFLRAGDAVYGVESLSR